MNRLGIGVIGCGQWGANHVRVFSQLRDACVRGAADLDTGRLASLQEQYPQLRCHQDYRELLKQDDIEAVVVSVPTSAHFAVARDALAAGKHVLCEKPLCPDVAEAEALVVMADARSLLLMTGHVFLFNYGIVKLRDLAREDHAGRLYYLRALRTNLGPVRADVNCVYDLASHDVSIFNFLLGSLPESVSGLGAAFLQPGIEDVAFITLRYPNEVLAHVQVSWLDPKKLREIVVVGDRKMIVWDELAAGGPVQVYDKGIVREPLYDDFGQFNLLARHGDITIPRIQPEEPLKAQNRHFLACIRTGRIAISDGRFSLGVVKVLDAVQESMRRRGTEVAVCQ